MRMFNATFTGKPSFAELRHTDSIAYLHPNIPTPWPSRCVTSASTKDISYVRAYLQSHGNWY